MFHDFPIGIVTIHYGDSMGFYRDSMVPIGIGINHYDNHSFLG